VNKEAGRYFLFSQRDIATATKHYETATEIQDSDFHGWGMLAVCYHAAGDEKKVRNAGKMMVSEAQRAVQQDPSNGAALGILAGGYALLGEREKAHEWIQRALLIDPDNVNMRYNFACILAGYLRDTEAALSLLQSTLSMAGQDQIRIAEADPDLDPIRDDPRFQKLLAGAKDRLGMVDAAAAI
jgi:adenylate cyclase